MTTRTSIDLAREGSFRLGPVAVVPPLRQLVHDDGRTEILEPRVMEVLVALARAGGQILTRDDLTACCWEGRVVGEDAINRVISRLRRCADGIGKDAFRIETITKVGYRLITDGADQSARIGDPDVAAGSWPRAVDRRLLLASGGVAAGAALAAGAVFALRTRRPAVPPSVAALYDQGWTAMGNSVPDQVAQAQGLFRQVVAEAPDYADGWAALAIACSLGARDGDPSLRAGLQAQSRSAAERALQLEPDNALAEVAIARLSPTYGNWGAQERALDAARRRHPNTPFLLREVEWIYASTGRIRAAADLDDRATKLSPPSVLMLYRRIYYLWGANRLEEADRVARSALETFHRSRPLWFTVFYYFMYTGRPDQALTMSEDLVNRPVGVEDFDFENVTAVAQAVRSRAKVDIDRAIEMNMKAARLARGYAENALQFAAFLGRPDAAFEVAEAYYFGRGFQLGSLSFNKSMGQFYAEPRTYFLFLPSCAPIHADPRFDRLMNEIGLKDYWNRSGKEPDYLAGVG